MELEAISVKSNEDKNKFGKQIRCPLQLNTEVYLMVSFTFIFAIYSFRSWKFFFYPFSEICKMRTVRYLQALLKCTAGKTRIFKHSNGLGLFQGFVLGLMHEPKSCPWLLCLAMIIKTFRFMCFTGVHYIWTFSILKYLMFSNFNKGLEMCMYIYVSEC